MERSIENIWKQQHPIIPRIEGLYKRKSKITIDRIRETQKWDNRALWLLALMLLAGFGYAGHWILGGYTAVLMVVLYFYNRRLIRNLESVQFTDSVRAYLDEFLSAVQQMIKHYTRLLLLGVPILALPALSFWLHKVNPGFEKFLEQEPWYIIVGSYLTVGSILGLYSMGVYRLVTHLLYGAKIRKLKETKAELEELEGKA